MKYDSLKKYTDRHVKIRPALQRYDDAASLEATLEDAWWLTEITSAGARLKNQATDHSRVLGLDHIHHYMEDPDSERTGGTHGILVLNVQLLLFKGQLLVEPVAPPGTPLKSFTPTQTRENLFSAAKRRKADVELSSQKEAFASSPVGVKASDDAFYSILEGIDTIEAMLREQGNPIEITRKHFGFMIVMGAFGWWASITWERYMNTLQNSRLTIKKWDGHPPFPNVMCVRKPNCVAVDQYTFGLVNATEARWIDLSNSQRNFTSTEIVEKVLQDFMNNPLNPAATWFE